MFRLPHNPLAVFVVLLWWPVAFVLYVAFVWWVRLLFAPQRVRIIH